MDRQRLPVWALILIDLAAAAVCIGLVLLILYVIPHGTKVEQAETEAVTQFALPSDGSGVDLTISAASQSDWSHADTLSIAADQQEIEQFLTVDKKRKIVQQYHGTSSEFTIEQVSCTVQGEPLVYYVADVYVSTVYAVHTAFANDMYGKNIRDFVSSMARENNAILAISGDSYGESDNACVIRNGVLYHSNPGTSDVCVLFRDGVMKTYSAGQFDAETVMQQGAWQAWTFGPALLDGNGGILSAFHSTEYLNKINPRAAIGYVAPGHYVFVVVDGRQEEYSAGVTMNQLAALMQEEGCLTAYNLDGGKSAVMVYDGKHVSRPIGAGRTISDIIYIGEVEQEVQP